jgi:hypothetical protein
MSWVIHEAVTHLPEWNELKTTLDKYNQQWQRYEMGQTIPDGDIVRCPVWDSITYNDHRGVMCDLEGLNAANYYDKLDDFLGCDWRIVRMGEFAANPKKWIGDRIFIKPAEFGKKGGAHVIQIKDIDFYKNKYKIPDDMMMVLASPISFQDEYRVIVNNSIGFTACKYKHGGKMDIRTMEEREENELLEWVNSIVLPEIDIKSPAFVLDVGVIEESNRKVSDEWAVVELNSFSSSGFYKCSIDKIVKELINEF